MAKYQHVKIPKCQIVRLPQCMPNCPNIKMPTSQHVNRNKCRNAKMQKCLKTKNNHGEISIWKYKVFIEFSRRARVRTLKFH